MPVNNLIQLRRGDDWGNNPVLSGGEPGLDSNYNIFKIGDGITAWSGLAPANFPIANSGDGIKYNGIIWETDSLIAHSGDNISIFVNNLSYISGLSGPEGHVAFWNNDGSLSYRGDQSSKVLAFQETGKLEVSGVIESSGIRIIPSTDNFFLGNLSVGTSDVETRLTISGVVTASGGNSDNWNTAYGWGDHSTVGYLTSHPTISAASSSDNSGRTYIQDIALDSNGHVTSISTATETVVVDSSSVDSAGAVMNSDTATSSMNFVIDEDDMSSNSDTKIPTQQSVKAYVDANSGGGGGTYTAGTGLLLVGSEFNTTGVLYSVQDDTSPQLGGNLDINTYSITGIGNINIDGNIIANYFYSDISGTLVTANSGNFIDSLTVNDLDVLVSGDNISLLNNDTGYISNIVEDITPQLGGNLDQNNNSITGVGNINTSGNIIANTGAYNALTVNSISVSVSGHTHTASDITNFNSSVSGLLPVKNISAGYDISISSVSGNYTIASTNLVHVDSKQPQGFINRTDSRISVSGNIFTIAPTGSSYSYYNQGIKVIKTSGDSLTIPNLTQINYIHFDTINNQLSNKTTGFDFTTDIPIAYIAWNSGVSPSGQMTFFAEERHGIAMDNSTHKWIHNTFGAQYVDGLSIGSYVLDGNGSSNSHATISIGNGTLYQEDIVINITDSSSTDPFCQELSPIAQIPVYYHEGSTGQWVKNTATDYPVKYGANGPQYNLFSDGTWTIPDVGPGGQTRYFAVWILATNQIDDPIISIMGQRIDSNQGSAESNNSWSDVNLTNLPLSEVKPLYRLIFAGDSDYTNVPKCSLLSILDIRVSVISTIAGVTQNDHGSLFGLGDDDHSQYVHIDNARTINAIHTFENGLTSNGLISSSSGNFTTLQVNGTAVPTGVGTTNYVTKWTGTNSIGNSVVYDNGTNVGIGTASPVEKLYVNGSIGNLGWRINEGAITTTGSGVGNGVAITLNAQLGTALTTTFQYKVRLTTYGTGTTTGATYLVHYNTSTSAWVLREVGLEGNTSNHPLLAESGGELIAYTNNVTGYGIRYLVESYNTADADSTPNSMGADYHWQRLGNNLYYIDGNVSIGTTTASNRLNVEGGNIVFNDLGGNYDFRVEGDTDANLLFTDASNDNVGIGALVPSEKLDIRYPAGGGMALIKDSDSNDGLLFGDMAYSASNAYQGIKHVSMIGTSDYMMMSAGTDNHVSAKAGSDLYLRGGGNSTTSQIKLTASEININDFGSNCDFRVEGDTDANLLFTDASADKVGIGTASPATKLHINSEVAHAASYSYDTNSLTVVHPTPTSNTTLNDPKDILYLARQGSANQAFGAAAAFSLSRYQNSSTNSRTRLDIDLAHGQFLNGKTKVMTMRSDGNVGIGTASPQAKLDVNGDIGLTDSGFYASPTGVMVGTSGWLYNDGQTTLSHGNFTDNGDAQNSSYVLRTSTTNDTFTTIANNGSSIRLSNNRTFMFTANIVARRTNGQDNAAYKLEGIIANDGYGASILGTPVKTILYESDSSWDVQAIIVSVNVDSDTSDDLLIQGKGAASKNINWVCKLDLLEVGGDISGYTELNALNTNSETIP